MEARPKWKWAAESLRELETIDQALARCAGWALTRSRYDLMAREGRRGRDAQEAYFRAGLSRARYGESAHNAEPPAPARAIHLIPIPLTRKPDGSVDWSDRRWLDACAETSGLMRAAGFVMGVEIVWGGSWRSLYDPCHYELG